MRAKAERKSRPRSAALGLAGAPALQAVPPTAGASADAAIAALHEALAQARGRLDGDPYANPIALLALDLEQKLGSGVLDEHAAAALIQRLTREAFAERAAASRRYLGELDPARNRESIRQLLMGLARTADGAPQPFAVFAAGVERVYYGFVFTAHPTFGRTMELQTMLAAAAFGPDGDPQREQILARAERLTHRPPARLDLPEEHAQSIQVIRQVRAIVREVYEVAFDVARELYPDDWRKLRPRLLTLATWVGYDTDGRADIGWTITFAKRLMVQLDQLKHYRAVTQSCLERAGSEVLLVPRLGTLACVAFGADAAYVADQLGSAADLSNGTTSPRRAEELPAAGLVVPAAGLSRRLAEADQPRSLIVSPSSNRGRAMHMPSGDAL